ncbi:hypothetical protein CEXT_452321 [Caerostris extrusa]|uniref:Uncharacterized protein n=1 Tax=Caerostris extrusa TaxID=172846 RepID=A0AAV4Y997_CAEEX|nr:hypothetical protein CEXT_452321 [Caerostris extrusa]
MMAVQFSDNENLKKKDPISPMKQSPETSSSCSGGTQRHVEKKKSAIGIEPIKRNFLECKKRAFGPVVKCRFIADRAGLVTCAESL